MSNAKWSSVWAGALAFGLACGPEAPPPSAPGDMGPSPGAPAQELQRLHWFLPDGMRADPEVFDVFAWAEAGKLPNLKRMMDNGTYGYSIPTFPSHTPTNFATLMTGAPPAVHGVADGPMRTEGGPLARPSVGGFSSTARKVPAAWSVLEETGRSVALLSMPGSTPPELQFGGLTVRGRWGGWGADFPAVIFENLDVDRRKRLGRLARLFMLSTELTQFVEPEAPTGAVALPEGNAARYQARLSAHGAEFLMVGIDSDGDRQGLADAVAFSQDGSTLAAMVRAGQWSDWLPVSLTWGELQIDSAVRLHVVRMAGAEDFRVRLLFDTLNQTVVEPAAAADALRADAGPMVDFVDNFPAQLIHYPEDKATFLHEAQQSWEWHARAVGSVYTHQQPDAFFHNIYTPNQMLTSRWWMGFVDPASARYGQVDEVAREALWKEVWQMYQGLDTILGEGMKGAGPGAVVVLSSDHGAAPMNEVVRLNDFFASKGWLQRKTDPSTGAAVVDWERSSVVFLQMYSVYINPQGLGGNWTRASGPAYEALRAEVTTALMGLRGPAGQKPVASVVNWEESGTRFLPADRVGDLIVSNHPGFGWSEETTDGQVVFEVPQATGYKQAIEPESTQAVWTPFVIVGPGIRAGNRLDAPIQHVDQLPTVLRALGVPVPPHVTGTAVAGAFE